MKITFGFITDGNSDAQLQNSISSVERLFIPNCEIIVIGNSKVELEDPTAFAAPTLKIIPFDETVKDKWITKKKNLITEHATHQNIVYAHDYIWFDSRWYQHWLSFDRNTPNWNVACNQVRTPEMRRHSDWLICPYDYWEILPERNGTWDCALPYHIRGLESIQYISGNYWIAKKSFMEKYPLDESLGWGESEDVVWSRTWRNEEKIAFNSHARVYLSKRGKWTPGMLDVNTLNRIAIIKGLPLSQTVV